MGFFNPYSDEVDSFCEFLAITVSLCYDESWRSDLPALALNDTHRNSYYVSSDPMATGTEPPKDYPLDDPSYLT